MNATSKLVKAWESKNAKNAARAGGVSLMALSLAACGGSSEVAAPTVLKTVYDAAVTAKAAAEAEATAATTAKTAAETAKTAAEATATAATAAKVAAEAEATTATAAKTAAETAKTAAETAQATAEAAQAVAVAAQAAAETAKATADAALAAQNTAITDAGFADVDALIAAYAAVTAPVSLSLTSANDNLLGNIGSDTFTGVTANLAAADVINGGDGNDTLNLTLTATNAAFTVSNVETINADWNAFGTAGFDATNVTGADITLTSSKVGFLGSATVTALGANSVTAGTGMTGTLTANGVTTGTVNGTNATIIAVTSAGTAAATDVTVVNAGANTTNITVQDFNGMTVNAAGATTIQLDDDAVAADDGETATLNYSGAAVTLTNNVDDLTINGTTAGSAITIDAVDASLVVASDVATTITVATQAVMDQEIVTKTGSGTLTLDINDVAAAGDLDQVSADLISVDAASAGGALTVVSGQEVTFTSNLANATGLTVAGAGTSDTATLNLSTTQGAAIALTGIETTTINVTAAAVANAADATFADFSAGASTINLVSANDLTVTLAEAGTFDASGVTGALTWTQKAAAAGDLTGATGANNTAVFKGTTHANNFVGSTANDTVTFVNTTGSAVAVLDNGTNAVTANAVTTGTLVVTAGTGTDTVSATALTTGTVNINLGDGTNSTTLDGVFNSITATVTGGAGTDTITIDDATVAGDTIVLNGGNGADTLIISEDITAGNITLTSIENIDVGANAGAAVVNSTELSGGSFTLKASGATTGGFFTDLLSVEMDAAASVNFSNLTLDGTLADGIGGISLAATTGNDTIVGTSGRDTIDSDDGNDTVTGGAGADTMTAGAGNDVFVIGNSDGGNLDTTMDKIAEFNTAGADQLKLGVAGTALNYVEAASTFAVDLGGAAARISTAAENVAQANTALDGTVKYAFINNALDDTNAENNDQTETGGYLFVDTDLDGTYNYVVNLTDGVLGDIAFGDIIA